MEKTDTVKKRAGFISNFLNILLLITFILTIMAPLTGIIIHKLAGTLFLLLCIIHTCMYSKKLDFRKYIILGIVIFCFVSGILGMIFDEIPLILAIHKAISIISVFFLAIHIFIYHKRFTSKN